MPYAMLMVSLCHVDEGERDGLIVLRLMLMAPPAPFMRRRDRVVVVCSMRCRAAYARLECRQARDMMSMMLFEMMPKCATRLLSRHAPPL